MPSKTKLIGFFAIAMVLINLGLLAFLFFNRPVPLQNKEKKSPKEIIIDKLDFDEGQCREYEKLIQEHRKIIFPLDDKMKLTKTELFQLLSKDQDSKKDTLIKRLAKIQNEVEKAHFEHFMAIKKLCVSKEQKTRFNELTTDLPYIFGPKPPRK